MSRFHITIIESGSLVSIGFTISTIKMRFKKMNTQEMQELSALSQADKIKLFVDTLELLNWLSSALAADLIIDNREVRATIDIN